MNRYRAATSALATRLRAYLAVGVVCAGAAIVAIGLSLIAMSVIVLVASASSAASLSAHILHVALDDGAAAFYLTQLVSLSFFHHTAGLRFAALPGLVLIGLAIATAAMVAARVTQGSMRKRMLVATLTAVPYALLSGLGARYLPLRFTAPGIGNEVPVLPSAIEAFVLPLGWGLLFAPVGGLVGVFGRGWRREAGRLLGVWATPLRCTLRALAASLALTSVVALVGGAVLVGQSGDARSFVGGSFGHAVTGVVAALVALPTLVVSLFLACFGVSFDWRVEALSRGHGSGSVLGGALPTTGANPSHDIPGLLVLLLLIAAVTVLAAGWLTARRSEENVRLSIANALRAGALMTLICWLFGLMTRVDAQAGGFLGFHFEADAASLLWRVPLWCFVGSATGAAAYVATRGASSRRQLAAVVLGAAHPSPRTADQGLASALQEGLVGRAVLGISFISLPAMLIGIGPVSAASSVASAPVSFASISQPAETRLQRDTTLGTHVSVTVDPSTRVIDTASMHVPLSTLGIASGESSTARAKTVLAHYGNMFGLSQRPDELRETHTVTDHMGMTHVYFNQMADGVPVFTGRIGVHFSPDGKALTYVGGSIVPEVSVADGTPAIDSNQAISLAKAALPGGELVQAPNLQVYAGPPSRPSGPTARLAWFVWLRDKAHNVSSEYVVDAVNGQILYVVTKTVFALDRMVYTLNHAKSPLPGTLVRQEGEEPTGDKDTDNAYEYTGDTYKYYSEWLGRDSVDNNGLPLVSTVHYGENYEDAYWNGQQMVFGDNYASSLDVVGHELSHGVTQYTAGLVEEGQSGALNESFSDAMGESVEYYTKGKTDWLMGTNLPIGPIRSLKKPNEYSEEAGHPDPEKLSEYDPSCQDNGGVHENSTITSHAYYLIATSSVGVETAAKIWYRMQTVYLTPDATLEDARNGALQAASDLYGSGSSQYKEVESALNTVGLNGTAQPPAPECGLSFECSFVQALKDQQAASGGESTLAMLATLYRARGELAQTSAAGRHFMPLYEHYMGRITELVSRDPTLEEMAVGGLKQITPALNGLMEGEGEKFTLSSAEMAQIEAALKRLAQDDRMFSGGSGLAKLIDHELKWLRLRTYGNKTYASGFKQLNTAVEVHTDAEGEGTPPPPAAPVVDPSCGGKPYTNSFQIYGFHVDTPSRYIPGQVSPMVSGGVACGTSVEKAGEPTECRSGSTLNTKMTLELPPGDKVNSTKNMTTGSWVGEAIGRVIACAGTESRIIYGGAALRSLASWTSQCPTAAIACYEGTATYEEHTGHGYSWITEEANKRLVLTTSPIEVTVEGHKIPVGFTEFGVSLCARAGEPGKEECGTSTSAPWIHENGQAGEPGCPSAQGRYVARVTNQAGKTTAAESCVHWNEEAYTQTIDAGNSLNAVSCVPATTDCVVTDSKGNALYSTNVSATAAATWKSWSGPTSPGEALACPKTSLCALGDGKATEGGGGNMYYATSLGGSWTEAFKATHGVLAVSCPSSSFCVDAQESGRVRYSTSPASTSWTEVTIGSGSMNGVFCLSSSFCAAVNGSGDLYVANTEAHIKEASGWKSTDVDGSTALHGVACTSTTSCVAVDGAGNVINLVISSEGVATASKQDIDGTNELTAITCTASTCVTVDNQGNIFVSTNAGTKWTKQYDDGYKLTSVSCAAASLCAALDTAGNVTTFNPVAVPPSYTQTIDTGNSLNAASCIPTTTDCVVSDSKGNALYSTNVSTTSSATWHSWSGPTEQSPSQAVDCPSSTVCLLADGKETAGGKLYYASSLGGTFTEAYTPSYGVDAITCASSSFCVDGQDAWGYFRYSTNPASTSWTVEEQDETEATSMKGVFCLSSSFCAIADSKGKVHVATSTSQIESSSWKETDVDGTSALDGVACISTTSCVAVDGAGDVLNLAISSEGVATAVKHDLDGTNKLTAVTCTGSSTCAAVDNVGRVFVSTNGGETWKEQHTLGTDLTSVSCASNALCVTTDTTGKVTAFDAR